MSDSSNLSDAEFTVPGLPSTPEKGPDDVDRPSVKAWQINILGIFLVVFTLITGYLIYAFWPNQEDKGSWSQRTYLFCSTRCDSIDCPENTKIQLEVDSVKADINSTKIYKSIADVRNCRICITLSSEQRIIILVLLAGALGSFIHAATSFSNFVGEGKIEKSWIWWYLLRPIIGMSIALVFYLVFRGGLLNDTRIENMNIYGVLTMSALSGLFTDRATLKLREIFETLFKPEDKRKGTLTGNNGEIEGNDNANG